jgi:cyanophycinase-like exopeptidase
MSGWILASGGNEFSSSYDQADLAALSKRSKQEEELLVVVTAPFPTQVMAYEYASQHFENLGVKTVMSPILSKADLNRENIKQIATASSIYFAGGTPQRLTDAFIDTEAEAAIYQALENDAVIMGSSAGAMLCGAFVVMPGGQNLGRGLNLLPNQIVLPHFSSTWPSWAQPYREKGLTLLGLSEGASVLSSVTPAPEVFKFGEVFFN